MTAAQRQAKHRQKVEEKGELNLYKVRNAAEQRKSRQKKKDLENALPENLKKLSKQKRNEKTKQRVAKWRSLKKGNGTPPATSPAYKSNSARGKALARVKRAMEPALPQTPKRRRVIYHDLFSQVANVNNTPERSLTPDTNAAPHQAALPSETSTLVQEFYQRDDISRQAPGRKDVVNIRTQDGRKEKIQARHLTSSVMEVYAAFKEEFPLIKIGKSKFAELRPKNVLLSSKLPHNVCLCKYHENFIMAVNSLHKSCPNFPSFSGELPDSIVCAPGSRSCWLNECHACKDADIFKTKYKLDNTSESATTWYVWKSDQDNKLCKAVEEGTTEDLFNHISSLVPQFLRHCFIKRMQAEYYQKQREAITSEQSDSSVALLQVDFSENYTCIYQDEVQSAHWQQHQVSLFTAALYYNGILHPKVIASDNLTHAKETLLAYVDYLLEDLPKTVKIINVWSDGPSSQFKNRFIAAALPSLQCRHDLNIQWHYFATSHGKGPVDGIGGSVKRQVWSAVKERKDIVTNASTFVAAAEKVSNVNVIEMTSLQIDQRNEQMNLEDIFNTAPPMPGITGIHNLRIVNDKVSSYKLSKDGDHDTISPQECMPGMSISENDWCTVEYDGQLFPGEVQAIVGDSYAISVMIRAGAYWKWPSSEDKILYTKDKIKKILNKPVVVNSRGHYDFPDY